MFRVFSAVRATWLAIFFSITAGIAQGQLTLNINTSNQTLWFTGSDTGTPTDLGSGNWAVVWGDDAVNPGFPPPADLEQLFLASQTTATVAFFTSFMSINSSGAPGARFEFGMAWNADPGSVTISGNAVTSIPATYPSWSPTSEARCPSPP